MPHGKRRFAKNSESVRHFRLIARSGRDPEGKNEEASPLVLEPFVPPRLMGKKDVDEDEMLTIPESLQVLGPEVFGLETRGGIPEESLSGDEEYEDDEEEDPLAALDDDCYFPKDGYNYNQHLKILSNDKKKGGLGGVIIDAPTKDNPAEALKIQPAANQEEQDLMKALEDAELYEEFDDEDLDQVLAGGAVEEQVALWGPTALENEDLPDLALFKAMHAERLAAMAGEGKEQLSDEENCEGPAGASEPVSAVRFEQLLENEYNDDETGALDDDEIEGHITMDNLEDVLDEYLEERQAEKEMMESLYEPQHQGLDDVPRVIEETKAIIEKHYLDEDDENAETSEGESDEDESKNWDCESILSTLSNVSNRPGKIGKIKIIKKPAPTKDLAAIVEDDSEEDKDEDAVELPDVVTERPKNETSEEKKQRKAAVKEMRRICRRMKKESKDMYKQEAAKLHSKNSTCDIRENMRCLKL